MCLNSWRNFSLESKRYKVLVRRFGLKLAQRGMNSALNRWVEFRAKRVWMRGLLNKMTGGYEFKMMSSGFNSWLAMMEEERGADENKLEIIKRLFRTVEHMHKSKSEQVRARSEATSRSNTPSGPPEVI